MPKALSDREKQVLHLIARGYTQTEIATQLGISTGTVEAHRFRALKKLGLRSRADIVGYALQQGWLSE
jgi:RNA polymerase sigma factor (sigma-70 family)